MIRSIITLLLSSICFLSIAQVQIEGYVFETGNRGYIDDANIFITNEAGTETYSATTTDVNGKYLLSLSKSGAFIIRIEKLPFFDHSEKIEILTNTDPVLFKKHELERKPGYIFDITLAEKRDEQIVEDSNGKKVGKKALKGALVEVYNNTKKREVLLIENLQTPDFQVNLIKGNHYTILVRSEGYLSKRMEAFVDVKGCILCFEGVGDITPGVSDNLSNNNTIGTLLANVEMDRYFQGKVIGLNDIKYETNKANLTADGKTELDKVGSFFRDNPDLMIELGAHTDSRGKTDYNKTLSERRANAARKYLLNSFKLDPDRIIARGYGEERLRNNCGNNSKCSETKHAENRRTELTILKVSNSDQQFKYLRQMKSEELFEEILNDLNTEGQIKVAADETLEGVLERNEDASKQQQSIRELETVAQNSNSEKTQINKSESKSEEFSNASMGISSEESEQGAIQVEEPLIAPVNYKKPSEKPSDVSNGNEVFSGYKIVIKFSRYALPGDHPLFEKFEDLKVYTTADGNKLYMIESFGSRGEAEARMKKRYVNAFPKSYVIGFEDGIIVD